MLTVVLCFYKTHVMTVIRFFTKMICTVPAYFKNALTFFFKKTHSNNVGIFQLNTLMSKATKYKFILYLYIFVTMALCPYLDNLFNEWFDSEPYNFYYMLFFLILTNILINLLMTIPTKQLLTFKLFFIKIKSFYNYIWLLYCKLNKLIFFLLNEVVFKSFLFNVSKKFLKNICTYFTYWRPLFKRFSYFGFYKLTKSKFFKIFK